MSCNLSSYTSFSYSGISVKSTGSSRVRRNNGSKVIPGGPASLYDQVYKVTVTVKNSGKVDGNATPQLYIGFPSGYGEPPKVMRGFEKVMLKAGQSQQVTFCLKRKDIRSVAHQKTTVKQTPHRQLTK